MCDLVHANYDSVFELSGVVILKKKTPQRAFPSLGVLHCKKNNNLFALSPFSFPFVHFVCLELRAYSV